jgi:hypothetical protein
MYPYPFNPGDRELPRWILDLLAAPPPAGCGLHQWLFKLACALKPWRSDTDIAAILTTATLHCGRDTSREVAEAIRNARNEWQPGINPLQFPPRQPAWPRRDLGSIDAVAREGTGLADLWEASPWLLENERSGTEEIIDHLFPQDCLLCAGTCPQDTVTRSRNEWRGKLANLALMVPSPMSALTGRRKDGRISARCLDNTGPRRYLVVEFDFKATDPAGNPTREAPLLARLAEEGRTVQDLCAALLLRLAQVAPLILAVYSGGKSLHGWFPVLGHSPEDVAAFFRMAVALGADPATWSRCQLIRIPEGTRQKGKRQAVWYFNPRPIPARS